MKQAGVQSGNTTTSAICADILLVLQRANSLEKKLNDNHASIVLQQKTKSVNACGEIVSARKRLYTILGEIKDLSYRIKDHIADNIIDKLKDSRNISWVIKELQLLLVHILELESVESKLKRLLQELPKNPKKQTTPFTPKKSNTRNHTPLENNPAYENTDNNYSGFQTSQNAGNTKQQQKGRKHKNYYGDSDSAVKYQGGSQVSQNSNQFLNSCELPPFCYQPGFSYPPHFYGQDQVVVGTVMQFPQQHWQHVQNISAMQQQIQMQQFQQQQQQNQIQQQYFPPPQILPGYPFYGGYFISEM